MQKGPSKYREDASWESAACIRVATDSAVLSVQGHRLRGDQFGESAQTKSRAAPRVSPTTVPSAICIYKIIAMAAEICILIEASLNC